MDDRFIADLAYNGLTQSDLEAHLYTGLRLAYTTQNLNSKTNPQRGYLLKAKAAQFWRLDSPSEEFTKLSGDFRTYLSFTRNPRTVLVVRVGGEKLVGDHFFIESARLGGKTNLS